MAKSILTSWDMGGNQIINMALEVLATNPANPALGRMYFNSASNRPRIYSGVAWIELGTGGGGGGGDMLASTYDPNGNGVVEAAESVPWTGITARPTEFPPSAHTHVAANITDLDATIQTAIVNYFDTVAGADANADTLREIIDLLLQQGNELDGIIRRFEQDIGDGVQASIAVAHNLASLDVTVEVYEIASGATVGVDVVRTNANTVTIGTNSPMALNSHRVVVKR